MLPSDRLLDKPVYIHHLTNKLIALVQVFRYLSGSSLDPLVESILRLYNVVFVE